MKFGKWVVKCRIPILVLAVALLVPSLIGMIMTRINYDMLTYLPGDIDTVVGQDILMDEFGKGAFSFVIIEGMDPKDVSSLREDISHVDHVDTVLWYDDFADVSVPMEILPSKLYDAFNSGDSTMLAIFFDTSTSSDDTMEAITAIRSIAGKHCFVSGMSAMVTDLKDLCEKRGTDLCRYCRCTGLRSHDDLHGQLDHTVCFPDEYRYGNPLKYGYQLFPRRDLLPDQSTVRCPAAGCNHGLLYFPLAQLRRTEEYV